jgi:hypothetical protein
MLSIFCGTSAALTERIKMHVKFFVSRPRILTLCRCPPSKDITNHVALSVIVPKHQVTLIII